jgi:TrpR-related protein YerC/YecD
MKLINNVIWKSPLSSQLSEVLVAIDDAKTMQNFLRDVMTEKEIIEISSRLEAAKMLKSGKKYTEVIAKTKLSSRTVARISSWMRRGNGGYKAALDIIDTHSHIPPVSAE